MRRERISVLLFGLLATACRHDTSGEQETQASAIVKCMAPTRTSVDVTTVLQGRIAAPPGGDLPVASQVPGRIDTVSVREGDHVSAGTLVATIDGSASRDALEQAEANVAQATAGQDNANATLERTKQLVARGIAAKQELDDAKAKADQAHAALASANAASDLARRTLGRVQVKSTFDGVVTRVWRGPGALVDGTAATPIVQLSATALAEVDADATERQLDLLRAGQTASVQLVTQSEPLRATLRTRATALDSATGLGLVRFDVPSAAPLLLGAFATITVQVEKRDDVLVIPASAMRGAVPDGAEVVVCNSGRADIRTVKVGWRDDDRAEITGGLKDDERVVVDRALGLQPDTPLTESR